VIVVVMGVTGSGKTTVGRELAQALEFDFVDADDFHGEANVAKMRAGTPLTDADRAPWLDRLNALLQDREASQGGRVVLACSALKNAYRARLTSGLNTSGLNACRIVHLVGSKDVLAARLEARAGHYMNPALLDSQLAILEPPASAIEMDISKPVATMVRDLCAQLAA
jgi:gluconokinase